MALVSVNHVIRRSWLGALHLMGPNSTNRETLGAPISGLFGLFGLDFCTRKWRRRQPSLISFMARAKKILWAFCRCAWLKQTNKQTWNTRCGRAVYSPSAVPWMMRNFGELSAVVLLSRVEICRWQWTKKLLLLFYCNLLQTQVILTTLKIFHIFLWNHSFFFLMLALLGNWCFTILKQK